MKCDKHFVTAFMFDAKGAIGRYTDAISQQGGFAVITAAGIKAKRGHHYQGFIRAGVTGEVIEMNVGREDNGFTMEMIIPAISIWKLRSMKWQLIRI